LLLLSPVFFAGVKPSKEPSIMSEAFEYYEDALEKTTATFPGSSLSRILFPDFENVKTSISVPCEGEAQAEANTSPAFIIDDPSKASWAIARILEAEAGIAERTALADSFKARIDQWLDSANRQANDSIEYLSFLLEPYVKGEVAKQYKSRSLSLPTGTASLRKLPDRLEIKDSTVALAYCEAEHPQAVIIKKELDKSVLKDLILKQAEPIPGVEAETGPDKLYIKPLKLKAAFKEAS
jgi:phage host-nuclease inhibitor protein Gam